MKRVWRAIDLFSGCGGLTQGLEKAGFRVVSAVEIDALAADTYEANHPGVKLLRKDICEVASTQLLPRPGLQVDLVAGCPPCQGFSRVRRKNRPRSKWDERNTLIDEFLRVVEELRPTAVFLENVPGIERYHRFHRFLGELRKCGYEVSWGKLDLSKYGVPQRRHRVVVLAGKGFKIDLPQQVRQTRTVRHAIGNLPRPYESHNRMHRQVARHDPRVMVRIKAVPKNGGSRSDWPQELVLRCHKKCQGFKDVYGRMAWDAPSPTITGGCINASKGRFLHPQQDRVITLFEAALLQTFPRKYRFKMDRGRYPVAEMIGNALPPEFARRVAECILRGLKAHDDD